MEHPIMRTPGRRVMDSRWTFRIAGMVATCMLAVSVWFTYGQVVELRNQTPINPHFKEKMCFVCHEAKGMKVDDMDCYRCHDLNDRSLKPNAKSAAGGCAHPIKGASGPGKVPRPVTQLCLSCHKKVTGLVALYDISRRIYVEIDISKVHPIGLRPTESIHPNTLPLSDSGAINCITCHDQHGMDPRMRLLRMYHPGNGHPADFRPLCNDCHADGWQPITMRVDDVVTVRDGQVLRR